MAMRSLAKTAALSLLVAFAALPLASRAATGAEAAAPPAASSTINPGDQIGVQVVGETTLTQNITVGPDGMISYPLLGSVKVAGLTASQASDSIRTGLQKYLKHPVVAVSVIQEGQSNVLVMGNVKTPGKYPLRSNAHLSDAVAAAGGLGPTNGEYPEVRVTSPDGHVDVVSLQKMLVGSDSQQNIPIANNSLVYVVGPQSIHVEILGAVDRPGDIEISEGDRLSAAIARAGVSASAKSDLNHVTIKHVGASTGKPVEINMYNALKGGDDRYDPILQKGDTVFVPQGKQPMANIGGWLLGRLFGI